MGNLKSSLNIRLMFYIIFNLASIQSIYYCFHGFKTRFFFAFFIIFMLTIFFN